METYSSTPFISLDGADAEGKRAEVKVVTGYGRVKEVEPSKAGKSFKVSFEVENTEFNPSGWAPDGSNVLEKIREAESRGEPIHFRLETRRQKHIDRSLPLAEVAPPGDTSAARKNIHKSLAAVKFEGDDAWTVSQHAVTNMIEDPKDRGGNGIYSAANLSAEELAALNGGAAPEGGGAATVARSFGVEPDEYVARLASGAVNPGSVAALALFDFVTFVAQWDRDHEGEAVVGEKKHVVLAKALLAATNAVQLGVFDGELERANPLAPSHKNARAVVFEIVRAYYPLSAEVVASKEAIVEWKENVEAKALGMFKWAISEIDGHLA